MENLYNLFTDLEIVSVQSISENQAFASVNLNPNITWAKFTLTDDLPNGNKQRVPKEEFENLISTGIYMPIKMEAGTSGGDHAGSIPLGTIAHLKVDNNKVKGLAALWNQERPLDIDLIKEEYKSGKPLRLSWELAYAKAEKEDDISSLKGIQLMAVTIVGNPAYGDRTLIEALSSAKAEKMEDTKEMDLEKTVEDLKNQIEVLDKDNKNLKAELDVRSSELEKASAELVTLTEFKDSVEKERKETEKLVLVKEKFSEAELKKDNEYFVENKELFLEMSETALNFMLQEMVSGMTKASLEDNGSGEVPNLTSVGAKEFSIKELAQSLRERNNK